jgi:hypothetical protein
MVGELISSILAWWIWSRRTALTCRFASLPNSPLSFIFLWLASPYSRDLNSSSHSHTSSSVAGLCRMASRLTCQVLRRHGRHLGAHVVCSAAVTPLLDGGRLVRRVGVPPRPPMLAAALDRGHCVASGPPRRHQHLRRRRQGVVQMIAAT